MSVVRVDPDYADRAISNVLDAAVNATQPGPLEDLRERLREAEGVVLVVLDGLGEEQLQDRVALAPWLASHRLTPITSVAPSTTASALTSITTGVAPGVHGIVGYRFVLEGDVLQALRWTVDGKDASHKHAPEQVQKREPKLVAHRVPIPYVGRAEHETSSFTRAHLRGCDYRGAHDDAEWVAACVVGLQSSRVVLAYYDIIDKVAHAEGLGAAYDNAVSDADALLRALRAAVQDNVRIVVTADHGQVDVGPAALSPLASTLALVEKMSGEGRFRWLHAYPGQAAELAHRVSQELSDSCWVLSRREVCDSGLLGDIDDDFVERLGDVAIIPFRDVFVPDPAEPREVGMKGRHGSLTPAEMWVPLIVG